MKKNIFDLTGDVALVTGASRGLGRSFAKALASAGADVVITGRSSETLKPACQEIEAYGGRVLALELDVCDHDSIRKMVADATSAFGKIDILVNNAGCNIRKPSLDVAWEEWDRILNTILKGSFFMAQAAARGMKERGYGRIINVGSATSVFGNGGIVPYCASRGGIKQMTMGLADEWAPFGITVNCLAPGWFKTEQTKVLFENAAWVEHLNGRIPQNRPGQEGDLDGAITFLASRASTYMTGQIIFIDGGYTIGSIQASGQFSRV